MHLCMCLSFSCVFNIYHIFSSHEKTVNLPTHLLFFLCWRLNQIPPTNPTIFALCSVFSHSINNKKSCSSHLSLILPLLLPSLISSLSRFLLLFLNIYIWNWQETGASKAKRKEFHFVFLQFFPLLCSFPCHFFIDILVGSGFSQKEPAIR